MGTVKDYKCPCCGASVSFDASNQSMKCMSCGTEFSLETMQALDEISAYDVKPSKYD